MHAKMDRVDELERMRWSSRSSPSKGPKRLCKFCLLAILLPVVCLCIPLYMRFQALKPHLLMLSPADMKLLNQESRVSTVWCQGQHLSMNGSFNAYLLPQRPKLLRYRHHVNMNRDMMLKDDIKEFWGFYLLRGSTVRLSVCSRHEGASFIIVKSLKDAKRCSFLGELDSVEESDEISNEFEFTHQFEEYLEENDFENRTNPSATIVRESANKADDSELAPVDLSKMSKPELVRKLLQALQNKRNEDNSTAIRKFRAYKIQTDDEEEPLFKDNASEDPEYNELDKTTLSPADDDVYDLMDRGAFDQQNSRDRSREETQSSWSSSEEALQNCEGLIINEQLFGGTKCHKNATEDEFADINTTVTLLANETGFYYFIFANENEITDNFLSARFQLHKTVFDVSANVLNCTNTTSCQLPLTFWSEDHVVLEVPDVPSSSDGSSPVHDDPSSNQCTALHGYSSLSACHRVILAESICEPRRALYMALVLCVPVLILIFAYI